MRVALIGQPNCGKSTLFNQVAGYKAETGNFSGTTVTCTESRVRVAGEVIGVWICQGRIHSKGEARQRNKPRSIWIRKTWM